MLTEPQVDHLFNEDAALPRLPADHRPGAAGRRAQPTATQLSVRRRRVPQVLPAERLRRHRPDAAPRRQDPRLRSPASSAAAVAGQRIVWRTHRFDTHRRNRSRKSHENCSLAGRRHRYRNRRTKPSRCCNVLGEKFELEEAPVGGAGYDAHGHPLPEATLKLAQGSRRHPVRRRRRLEIRQARARAAPGAGHSGPAQEPAAVRQPASGDLLSGTGGRVDPEAGSRLRAGYPDRARTDRRHLFRPAARRAHRAGRPVQRRSAKASTPCVTRRPKSRRIAHVAFQAAQKRSKR